MCTNMILLVQFGLLVSRPCNYASLSFGDLVTRSGVASCGFRRWSNRGGMHYGTHVEELE